LEDAAENLARMMRPGTGLGEARRLHHELSVYESGEFRKNRDSGGRDGNRVLRWLVRWPGFRLHSP
jgi:hypothetical protein